MPAGRRPRAPNASISCLGQRPGRTVADLGADSAVRRNAITTSVAPGARNETTLRVAAARTERGIDCTVRLSTTRSNAPTPLGRRVEQVGDRVVHGRSREALARRADRGRRHVERDGGQAEAGDEFGVTARARADDQGPPGRRASTAAAHCTSSGCGPPRSHGTTASPRSAAVEPLEPAGHVVAGQGLGRPVAEAPDQVRGSSLARHETDALRSAAPDRTVLAWTGGPSMLQ